MAKSQSFADKSKAKKKSDHITVKFVKSVKSDKGTYKFSEKFVRLADISKVTELKWIILSGLIVLIITLDADLSKIKCFDQIL